MLNGASPQKQYQGDTAGNQKYMISLQEAKQIVMENAVAMKQEYVPVSAATGRVMQQTVVADRDYPPFNRSTMDGFAFRFEDWRKGVRNFRIVETIYAGNGNVRTILPGDCYRIMTGAAVPADADVVVKIEEASVSGGFVQMLTESVKPFQHIALKGEDITSGTLVTPGNLVCNPGVVGVLAALGYTDILVSCRPVVSIITTGNEVVPYHSRPSAFQIRNSNAAVLNSILNTYGICPKDVQHIGDDKEAIKKAIATNLSVDILIVNGGVSAGDADYVPQVMDELRVGKLFHKVAIKPGKPLWVGRAREGAMVFALPGNPFSCIVTGKIFIEPYILSCMGMGYSEKLRFPISAERENKSRLDEFFPVVLDTGKMHLQVIPFNTSGDITAALKASGIAHQSAGTPLLGAGTWVDYYPFHQK